MGAQRHMANGIEVWCLRDGTMTFPEAVFPDLAPDTRAARLAAAGQSEIDTVFNAYLLRHPDGACDLIDTGCGARRTFGPAAGLLPSRLKALGVTPRAVRRVILTHLHGDHAGGAVLGGGAAYPEADLLLHAAELGAAESDDALQSAYAGRIRPVQDGDDLGGFTVWHLPGHTPGHIGFRFGADLALVTDILHSAALQAPDPALCPVFDEDPGQARSTRRAALAALAAEGTVWSGSHLVGPAFVRAVAKGDGFALQPV